MKKPLLILLLCAAVTLGACQHGSRVARAPAPADWRQVITGADRDRLRNWRETWVAAIAKARASGHAAQVDALGDLLNPDHALADGAVPPPGHYLCRVHKIGANGPAMQDFISYPVGDCTIDMEGEVSSLTRSTGPQRPVGLLFNDNPARAMFLGTLMLGDETKPMTYGLDNQRDLVGFVERIGPQRWRLAFPSPRFESMLDVVDIVPAAPGK